MIFLRAINRRRAVPLLMSLLAVVAVDGSLDITPSAHAQGFSRRDRSDDDEEDSSREGREERRSWRRDRDRDETGDDDRPSRSSAASASRPTSAASGSATSMNMTDYAKSLIRQHDKNGNLMLEAAEQSELRGKAASADRNKDGVIISEELVAHLSGNTPTATETTTSSTSTSSNDSSQPRERSSFFERIGSGRGDDSDDGRSKPDSKDARAKRVFLGSAGGEQAGADKKNKRRSYRFTPPAERLPTGLPGWFKSRDRNSDGQVAMSEYSRAWSARMVAEFRRYDLNDDGIVTPKEAAKK